VANPKTSFRQHYTVGAHKFEHLSLKSRKSAPDLNPIEHIWWILKKRVFDMFPEIAADRSESEDSRQRLESALQAA
jgi:hypothetical protein